MILAVKNLENSLQELCSFPLPSAFMEKKMLKQFLLEKTVAPEIWSENQMTLHNGLESFLAEIESKDNFCVKLWFLVKSCNTIFSFQIMLCPWFVIKKGWHKKNNVSKCCPSHLRGRNVRGQRHRCRQCTMVRFDDFSSRNLIELFLQSIQIEQNTF